MKSSNIISIGNGGNSCVVTHKVNGVCFQWNVGLIPINRNMTKALARRLL